MTATTLIVLALAVPAVTAALLPLFGARPNVREATTLIGAVLLFATVLAFLPEVLAGGTPSLDVWTVVPGLEIAFSLEPLGMLFALVASGLWIASSLYSIGYMRAEAAPRQTLFYACFALAISATMGIALSGNLFTLFLFYELLSFTTWPLVTHKGTPEARAGGRVYVMMLFGASTLLFLPAIAWTALAAGTLDFTPGGILAGTMSNTALAILLGLFAFGAAKAAVMPLHFWLPAAMVAPTPVSALLHAVAVVKAGVFTILKVVVYIFGLETITESGAGDWLVIAAGITIVVASLTALQQDNLKRRLAYSTVSQLSYVVMGAALASPLAILGAALHIAAHAAGKITLFFSAGSVHIGSHIDDVSRMNGVGRKMPWTMGSFTIGALSMIGVPPTAGFLGKWFIFIAAMQAGQWFAIGALVASTLLSASYFLPIVYRAFARPPEDGAKMAESPWPMVVSLCFTAALTIFIFLWPGVPYDLAGMLAGNAAVEPGGGAVGRFPTVESGQ